MGTQGLQIECLNSVAAVRVSTQMIGFRWGIFPVLNKYLYGYVDNTGWYYRTAYDTALKPLAVWGTPSTLQLRREEDSKKKQVDLHMFFGSNREWGFLIFSLSFLHVCYVQNQVLLVVLSHPYLLHMIPETQ